MKNLWKGIFWVFVFNTVCVGLIFLGTAEGATFYISPSGSNANDCTAAQTITTPKLTFASLFACGAAGDTYILRDGTYASGTTGYINGDTEGLCGGRCAQPPSGTVGNYTIVRAENDGGPKIGGGSSGSYSESLRVGTGSAGRIYLQFEGIKFTGGVSLYTGHHVILKRIGAFNNRGGAGGVVGIGTNDNDIGMTDWLIEDSWIWGNERISLLAFRTEKGVLRRVVMRQDGCASASTGCGNNSGNYMVGFTVYNSSGISLQNVLVADNILGPNGFAGASDIQTAWHTSADGALTARKFGNNEWLGCGSFNTGLDGCVLMENDNETSNYLNPMYTLKNIVCINGGFNMDMGGADNDLYEDRVENITVKGSFGSGWPFRAQRGNNASSYVRNVVAQGTGNEGINSSIPVSYMNVNGFTTAYRSGQEQCATGCTTANALTSALLYPPRIEAGSSLAGAGLSGADKGANIVKRYGTDGTLYGEANYNTLSSTDLWPWPNEARMKTEMCTDAGISRGWCAEASFTEYIWEALGNSCPAEICGSVANAGGVGRAISGGRLSGGIIR